MSRLLDFPLALPMRGYVIGVDLGGTLIKAAALDLKGKLLARTKTSTLVEEGPERTIANIVLSVCKLKKRLDPRPLLAVGVGVPGILDWEEGLVIQCPNLPGWEGLALRERLGKDIDRPVAIENDANAAALGERWLGAAKDWNNFMLITLGTGVGSGMVLDGKLWRGESGRAGELGHVQVEPRGLACGCGGRGCLEQYASATAIKRMALEGIKKGKESAIYEIAQGKTDRIGLEIVQKAARAGDPLAREIYRKVGTYLGSGIAAVVNLLDISNFVLAGGVSTAYDLFVEALQEKLKEQVLGQDAERIRVESSRLGPDVGMYGCAYLAITSLTAG